jgi:hypothetical protein
MNRKDDLRKHIELICGNKFKPVLQSYPDRGTHNTRAYKRCENAQDALAWIEKQQGRRGKPTAVGIQLCHRESAGARISKKRPAEWATVLAIEFDRKDGVPWDRMPKPSMVVETRKGLHVYYSIKPTKDIDLWKRVMIGLSQEFGGDMSFVKAGQSAILRVAGSYHVKGKAVLVRVKEDNPEAHYDIACFAQYAVAPERKPEPMELEERLKQGSGRVVLSRRPICRAGYTYLRLTVSGVCSDLGKVKAGERKLRLFSASARLGSLVPCSLPAGLAYHALEDSTRVWRDRWDRSQNEIGETILDGLLAGALTGPRQPEWLVAKYQRGLSRQQRHAEIWAWLEGLPDGSQVPLDEILDVYRDLVELHEGKVKSAKCKLADHLFRTGWRRKRKSLEGHRSWVFEKGMVGSVEGLKVEAL